MKNIKLFIILLVIIIPLIASAGGTSFKAEILDFLSKGNQEYKIVLLQYEKPYHENEKIKPRKITIHLRHHVQSLGGSSEFSREEYLNCIKLLEAQFRKGGIFEFGIMGDGYKRIMWKFDEYQSNTLKFMEDYKGNKQVVSFPGKI